jgi:hypothetical protein
MKRKFVQWFVILYLSGPKAVSKKLSFNDFCVVYRYCNRLGSKTTTVSSKKNFPRCFMFLKITFKNVIFYYLGVVFNPPKKYRDVVILIPKIPCFKINVSLTIFPLEVVRRRDSLLCTQLLILVTYLPLAT